MKCILCEGNIVFYGTWRDRDYHRCENCKSIMMDPKDFLGFKSERARYEQHNNDVNDKRYQNFVSPIVKSVLEDHTTHNIGLDFGAGTGPVISKLLRDRSYNIKIYDPFFANYPHLLEEKYNYIVCCEVMEHFHNPKKEFNLLRSILKPKGTLYCMTEIYDSSINFSDWYYKNDETHVFFYSKKALEIIKKESGFSNLKVNDNFIKFTL